MKHYGLLKSLWGLVRSGWPRRRGGGSSCGLAVALVVTALIWGCGGEGTDIVPDTDRPVRLAFAVQPSDSAAMHIMSPSVTVELRDERNERVDAGEGLVELFLEEGPEGAELGGTVEVEAEDGIAIFSDLFLAVEGVYRLGARSSGLSSARSAYFDVTGSVPSRFSVEVTPDEIVAGDAVEVKISALDYLGEVDPGYRGTVDLSSSDDAASTPGPYTFTIADAGTASLTATLRTRGNQTVTATDTRDSGLSSSAGVRVNSGEATTLVATALEEEVTAGEAFALDVALFDAYGNEARGYRGTVEVESTDDEAVVPEPYAFVSNDAGTATLLLELQTSGEQRLVVRDRDDGGLEDEVLVEVMAAPAASLVLAELPEEKTAGDVASPRVTAFDSFGNVATGYRGTVSFSSTCGVAVLPSAYTFDSGDAGEKRFSGGVSLRTAGLQEVEVSDAEAELQDSLPVEVFAAPVSALVLGGLPEQTPAGDALDVTLALFDEHANVAVDYRGTVRFSSSDERSALPEQYEFGEEDAGTASFSGGVVLLTAGEQTVMAEDIDDAGLSDEAELEVLALGPSQDESIFVVTPKELIADGVSESLLSVTVMDEHENLLPGVEVSLSVDGDGNELEPESEGVTGPDGVFEAYLSSTVAGVKTVTAVVDGGAFELVETVEFVTGLPCSETSIWEVEPGPATADGEDAIAVSVTVLDALENPVSLWNVSVTVGGEGNAFLPDSSGLTGPDGVFETLVTSTVAEEKAVAAFVGDGDDALEFGPKIVTFEPGDPSEERSTLHVDPSSVVADGDDQVTVTVTVLDAQDNSVPEMPVSVTAGGDGNVFVSSSSGVTGSNGIFTTSFTSTVSEVKDVDAVIGTGEDALELGPIEVTFDPWVPSRARSSLTRDKASATADGEDSITITVTVRDSKNNVMPDVPVELSVEGVDFTLEPTDGLTDSEGVFQASLTATTVGMNTFSAVVGEGSDAFDLGPVNVNFEVGDPCEEKSSLTVDKKEADANGQDPIEITVVLLDATDNPVPGVEVEPSVFGTGNTLVPSYGDTDSGGIFITTLTSNRAGEKDITVPVNEGDADFILGPVSVTFHPGDPSQTNSSLDFDKTEAIANSTDSIEIELKVRDDYGNLIPDISVELSVTGSENSLLPESGDSGESGIFSATLTSTAAEEKFIEAVVGEGGAAFVIGPKKVTFKPGEPDLEYSGLTVDPVFAWANGIDEVTITVTVIDSHQNPLVGESVAIFVTGDGNTLEPEGGSTNDEGVFTSTLTSTDPGTKIIEVSVAELELEEEVLFGEFGYEETYSCEGEIVTWVVETPGIYEIEAAGAQGGDGCNQDEGGGLGAVMQAEFELVEGDEVMIAAGCRGGSDWAGGGGGGSFVRINHIRALAAGGGGGSGCRYVHAGDYGYWVPDPGLDASTGTDGVAGTNGGAGGTDGDGGRASGSAGGAGIYNDGESTSGAEGGKQWPELTGGSGDVADGGYGGGGGARSRSGGGAGGYSGGGSGGNQRGGGGAGSHIDGTGSDQSAEVGNTGHGYVRVEYVDFPTSMSPLPPEVVSDALGEPYLGQDAQYGDLQRPEERFIRYEASAGQAVVLDQETQLEWQGCVAGLGGSRCDGGWEVVMSAEEALEFCEISTWGGYDDWRLPDREELHDIVDYGEGSAAIDGAAFPETAPGPHWTSSTYAAMPGWAWLVCFGEGGVLSGEKYGEATVRCVRAGSSR